MRLSRIPTRLMSILLLTGAASALLAADTEPKPSTPVAPTTPAKPKAPVVTAAIAVLQKEYQAYVKDPSANKLREKSDYFKQNASPDATPDAILKAIEGSVSGGYEAEAYVKWQLLSGIAGKFPDELLKRAIAAYRRAPSPSANPAVNHRVMNKAIIGFKKDQIPQIQKEFDAAEERNNHSNRIFLSYRDDFYSRLPPKYEVLSAGLEDLAERAADGLNANPIFDNVSAGLRSWSITEAKTGQVKGMLDAVLRIQASINRDENKPYSKLGEDNGILKWKAESHVIDAKKLEELIKFLQTNNTASGGGGLKFKNEK
jgi:hypothetical protein